MRYFDPYLPMYVYILNLKNDWKAKIKKKEDFFFISVPLAAYAMRFKTHWNDIVQT